MVSEHGLPTTLTNQLIYSLFNDAFNSSDHTASNERIEMNSEMGRVWKEVEVE
jgi:hypothetical protein